MRVAVLGSGSKGNSTIISSNGTSILIDAGLSGKETGIRLKRFGSRIEQIGGIFLTHEHGDHIRGAGPISRASHTQIYATEGTYRGGAKRLGKLRRYNGITPGEKIRLGALEIESYALQHDSNEPVGYVIDDGKYRVGYCTDTGMATALMAAKLSDCDLLILEFNHDVGMLKAGPYPPALQDRIMSGTGHLSNVDAAAFLKRVKSSRLRAVIMAHMSETNNSAPIALGEAVRAVEGANIALIAVGRDGMASAIDLSQEILEAKAKSLT